MPSRKNQSMHQSRGRTPEKPNVPRCRTHLVRRVTLPMAHPSSPEPPGEAPPPPRPLRAMMRRYDVERSCIRCHERKVRCNKAAPCLACTRARVPCRYPGPERAKRRTPRANLARHRVATLESTAGTAETGASPSLEPVRPTPSVLAAASASVAPDASPAPDRSGGFLLKDGSSTRYIDEYTFSRVLDKVRGSCDHNHRCIRVTKGC